MISAVLPLLGAIAGGIQVLDTMLRAESAPQQAAGMAMACAFAIVPYVFARSLEMLTTRGGAIAATASSEAAPTSAPSWRPWYTWAIVIGTVVVALLMTVPMFPISGDRNDRMQKARALDALDRQERERQTR